MRDVCCVCPVRVLIASLNHCETLSFDRPSPKHTMHKSAYSSVNTTKWWVTAEQARAVGKPNTVQWTLLFVCAPVGLMGPPFWQFFSSYQSLVVQRLVYSPVTRMIRVQFPAGEEKILEVFSLVRPLCTLFSRYPLCILSFDDWALFCL